LKRSGSIIWGIVLVVVGIIFAVNALGIADINVFFEGWWTLIIIIPCFVGLFTERDKLGNLIGLAIGVALLLGVRDIIDFGKMWKLLVPAVIIIIGLRMIFGGTGGAGTRAAVSRIKTEGGTAKEYCATFSGQDVSFDGEVFEGVKLTAVFGGIKCDLRGAVITKDSYVEVSSIFGGVDVIMPDNINVKISSNSIFGGISNKKGGRAEGAPTVFINGTCLFGGVDIK